MSRNRLKTGRSRIITYGTSLTAQYSARFWRRCGGFWVSMLRDELDKAHPGAFEVINKARWGSDSRWGLKHFESRVAQFHPSLLIIEFGINDADERRRISLSEARINTERLIDCARDFTDGCNIWLMTTHEPRDPHRAFRPGIYDVYEMYRTVAEQSGIGLIDLYREWGHLPLPDQYLPDGLHPSVSACRDRIVPTVIRQLKPAVDVHVRKIGTRSD